MSTPATANSKKDDDSRRSPSPESPTTAHPIDLDYLDDDVKSPSANSPARSVSPVSPVQKSGELAGTIATPSSKANADTTTSDTSAPTVPGKDNDSPKIEPEATSDRESGHGSTATPDQPPRPPRPTNPQVPENEQILKEAFPSIEVPVIRAILKASGGDMERAFNALLEMTDPDAVRAEPEVPEPTNNRQIDARVLSQLEADEQYARQLAEEYANAHSQATRQHQYRQNRQEYESRQQQQQRSQRPTDPEWDDDYNFMTDELPVIKETLKKGFAETQTKVNGWITQLKKKLDDAFDDDGQIRHEDDFARPGRRSAESRPSGDYDRYDADPHVITDDFAGLRLAPDGTPIRDEHEHRESSDFFRTRQPSKSPSGERRKVSFQDHVETIPENSGSPLPRVSIPSPSNSIRASKWQPLSAVEPSPVTENDPFSLGDSDDEETTGKSGPRGIKMEDNTESERLRKAAAEAMSDSLVDPPKK